MFSRVSSPARGSGLNGRPLVHARRGLRVELVSSFAMHGEVEAGGFGFRIDSQRGDPLADLDQHNRHHGGIDADHGQRPQLRHP